MKKGKLLLGRTACLERALNVVFKANQWEKTVLIYPNYKIYSVDRNSVDIFFMSNALSSPL